MFKNEVLKMQKKIIEEYFNMWLTRDFTKIDELFSSEIIYRECYGAVYQNLDEIHSWIKFMLEKQVVLEWQVKNIFTINKDLYFVEWFFKAKEEKSYSFDGISKIIFEDNLIKEIVEYETNDETFRPFKKENSL